LNGFYKINYLTIKIEKYDSNISSKYGIRWLVVVAALWQSKGSMPAFLGQTHFTWRLKMA
jgi:hypothetical protein